MRKLLVASLLVVALSSCSTIGASALRAVTGGGGPSLEVQAGAENTKQIVLGTQTQQRAERDIVTQRVGADRVEKITVNEGVPLWYWVALFLAIFVDSPQRVLQDITSRFRRKTNVDV